MCPTDVRENEYRRRMEDADRDVLEFIGDEGKTAEQVSDRFPSFDLERLVRAELVRPRRTDASQDAVAPRSGARPLVLRAHVSGSRGNRPRRAHASLGLNPELAER